MKDWVNRAKRVVNAESDGSDLDRRSRKMTRRLTRLAILQVLAEHKDGLCSRRATVAPIANASCIATSSRVWPAGVLARFAAYGSSLEQKQQSDPRKDQRNHSHSHIKHGHHVSIAVAHGGKADLLAAQHKDETASREAEAGECLGRRTRGENTRWGTQPEEEVRQAPEDCEAGEQVAPELRGEEVSVSGTSSCTSPTYLVNLNFIDIVLMMSSHCDSGDANDESRTVCERRLVSGLPSTRCSANTHKGLKEPWYEGG